MLKDPTDTSHFDTKQTGIPIYSPPKGISALAANEGINKAAETQKSSDLNDEFDEWHFSPQGPASLISKGDQLYENDKSSPQSTGY